MKKMQKKLVGMAADRPESNFLVYFKYLLQEIINIG